ncbi:MAG: prepilin-type N-terminal cleavage/methylation domain-containing protein [Solirubrobacterales bacterium]|nr:prepilin-type N-terminal cleavage/methylation domain-containing protein [Solirubrobacterales bacterium]
MGERGFTLVEVMVAMLILVVGLLGTVKLIDQANATTSSTKAREGATNLAREIVESARLVDYDDLTAAAAAPALQAKPGLVDSTDATTAWTIERRGIAYTLTVGACTYDDAKDGVTAVHDGSFCASTPAGPTTPTEANPDDFRRVDVTVSWPHGSGSRQMTQTSLIINPSGGLGPRIVSFLPVPGTAPEVTVDNAAVSQVSFAVTTTFAATVRWTADDAVSSGDAAGGATAWTFSWPLGQAAEGSAASVRDGIYQVDAQAFDAVGIPGDVRTVIVTVNRSAPFAPTDLAGGRNDRVARTVGGGDIVDLQWRANQERDIIGYRAFRVDADGTPETADDVLVCAVKETSCYDPSPPSVATQYYVRALDVDGTGAERPGTPSSLVAVPAAANPPPYFAPPDVDGLTVTIADGVPRLDWRAAQDDNGTVRFYRIYRDSGTAYAGRYARTETSATTYTDPEPGDAGTVHTYQVTAVDDAFNESEPITATVTMP